MKCSRELYISTPTNKKCYKCKKEAVVYLSYSNTYYCKTHFFAFFENRFKKNNREFGFIKKNDNIALALSGGKDSTLLLYLLFKFKKILPFKLFAITIDIGIHCDYWKKTIKIAKKYTKKFGVKHYIFSFKEEFGFTLDEFVDGLKIKNPCSYCGVFKRYMLNKKARELGADKLAIGHNLDDAVQTILLNLARNEPSRLARFNDHSTHVDGFVPRIKPLIRAPEEEIIQYGELKRMDLEGKRCCPYSIHAMRNSMRFCSDELESRYPGTKIKIFNSFLFIQKLMKSSFKKQDFRLSKCEKCGESSSTNICMCCKMISKFKKRN